VAKSTAALQADLYIIHTPHGISLSDAYAVYGNTHASGNALWLDQWGEFQVRIVCRAILFYSKKSQDHGDVSAEAQQGRLTMS